MESLKISVAMATYNGEKYIIPQLESLYGQTREIDEIIICDDGSTDKTVSIINDFISERGIENWFLYKNKQNLGFVGNFFEAVERTNGDVIFLCDQDDVWDKYKVEKMLAVMEQDRRIQSLNTAVRIIDGEGNIQNIPRKKGYCNANILKADLKEQEKRFFDFEYLVRTNISPGCTMCVSKELKNRFLEYRSMCVDAKFPHDWFLNMLASMENGVCFWNEPLMGYRIHGNNTIGVDTDGKEDGLEVRSTKKMREEIGRFHFNRAALLRDNFKLQEKKKIYIEKYYDFSKRRYEFLQKLSLSSYVILYKDFRMYKEAIGWHGMISDLLYALRLDQIFRR